MGAIPPRDDEPAEGHQTVLIAVCPVDMAKNWNTLGTGTPSPVSVFHTLTTCQRCNTPAWIGPQQREAARYGSEVICYRCIFKDEDFGKADEIPIISLNPDADDYPRRS